MEAQATGPDPVLLHAGDVPWSQWSDTICPHFLLSRMTKLHTCCWYDTIIWGEWGKEWHLLKPKEVKQMGMSVINHIPSFWNPKAFLAKAFTVLLHAFGDGTIPFFLNGTQPESCPSETGVKIDVLSVLMKQHLLIKTAWNEVFLAFCY